MEGQRLGPVSVSLEAAETLAAHDIVLMRNALEKGWRRVHQRQAARAALSKKKRPQGGRPERGRPFKPGQSGNPGGRPRVLGDVQELARQKSPEAINTLSNI